MRDGLQETPTIQQYLGGKKVGVHDAVISVADVRKFRQQQNIQLEVMRENLVDQIWAEQRPKRPANPVLVHPLEFAGEDAGAKMKRLREKMEEQNAEVLVVCALDEVACKIPILGNFLFFKFSFISRICCLSGLFNLRGADVKFNPVFFAYGVITSEQACLFINPQQLSEEVQSYLKELNVNVSDYSEISEYLKSMKVDQDRVTSNSANFSKLYF